MKKKIFLGIIAFTLADKTFISLRFSAAPAHFPAQSRNN
jgi:hypothetical protein